jgi:hypothetical protein
LYESDYAQRLKDILRNVVRDIWSWFWLFKAELAIGNSCPQYRLNQKHVRIL